MCLACEMDALWFAEMETAAAPGTAGVPPALSEKTHFNEMDPSCGRTAPSSCLPGEVKGAAETPPPPDPPPQAGEGWAGAFRCEETRSP
jgi:hypothetical protein